MEEKKRLKKLKEYEKNNDYISYRSSKIVFCQDGRILSIDEDTELVDLRDCENCKQKDQLIAELEKQLAIRDKALELSLMKEYWLEQAEEALKKEEGK